MTRPPSGYRRRQGNARSRRSSRQPAMATENVDRARRDNLAVSRLIRPEPTRHPPLVKALDGNEMSIDIVPTAGTGRSALITTSDPLTRSVQPVRHSDSPSIRNHTGNVRLKRCNPRDLRLDCICDSLTSGRRAGAAGDQKIGKSDTSAMEEGFAVNLRLRLPARYVFFTSVFTKAGPAIARRAAQARHERPAPVDRRDPGQ